MQTKREIIQEALVRLTGQVIDLDDIKVKGRNIYGRVPFEGRPGIIYTEIAPKDRVVNDRVMPTITGDDARHPHRNQIYIDRCQDVAKEMNRAQIQRDDLILLLAFNGVPTRTAKILFHALLGIKLD